MNQKLLTRYRRLNELPLMTVFCTSVVEGNGPEVHEMIVACPRLDDVGTLAMVLVTCILVKHHDGVHAWVYA